MRIPVRTCKTRAVRTCPTEAIEVILDLTPLYILTGRYANATVIKMVIGGTVLGELSAQELGMPSNGKFHSSNTQSMTYK